MGNRGFREHQIELDSPDICQLAKGSDLRKTNFFASHPFENHQKDILVLAINVVAAR